MSCKPSMLKQIKTASVLRLKEFHYDAKNNISGKLAHTAEGLTVKNK